MDGLGNLFLVVFSLHLSFMSGCLGNIWWRQGLQPVLLLAATLLLWNASCIYIYIYIYLSLLSSFSLFLQSTFFESSLLFFILLRAWDRIQTEGVQFSERARTRVNGRSRAGVLVDFFRFQFDSLRFDTNAMARFRVGGGVRSCVLPKEWRAFFPKTTASWHSELSK